MEILNWKIVGTSWHSKATVKLAVCGGVSINIFSLYEKKHVIKKKSAFICSQGQFFHINMFVYEITRL